MLHRVLSAADYITRNQSKSFNSNKGNTMRTHINFQGLSDYENSTTRTTLTSALALFYSACSHEHFDLFYSSLSAKLQNPPESKSFWTFPLKSGRFSTSEPTWQPPQFTLVRSTHTNSLHFHQFLWLSRTTATLVSTSLCPLYSNRCYVTQILALISILIYQSPALTLLE